MSFLNELKKQKNKLKETETVITKIDGQRYVEKDNNVTSISPNTYGFVVDTAPDNTPILITEYLYIGSQDCATNDILKQYNITHVLSLGIKLNIEVNNKFINCLDLPETDIKDILRESLPFIHKIVSAKENVLVHCNAGVSRTSMVAIGYLMHYNCMAYIDAYNLVKSKRPAVRPNDGFRKQLLSLLPGNCI